MESYITCSKNAVDINCDTVKIPLMILFLVLIIVECMNFAPEIYYARIVPIYFRRESSRNVTNNAV